ncbi:SPOR domain-containing protein [Thalassotalea atypica]|uniref:SPOR domain-containing protein n=1 Tax=Thalassotalea atypica TaxID=2054316 RepID=UPI002572CAF9|nr:SPOR domain-containing protein [Thalassotalea atypica]
MSTPFQNRLVGSIIVAAAVIIFLPDILDGEKKSYQADFDAIPEAPAFKSKHNKAQEFPNEKLANIPQDTVTDDIAIDGIDISAENITPTVENSDAVKVNVIAKPEKIASKQTSNTKQSTLGKALPEKSIMGEAWVIHLGSFKHKKNVSELVKKLKDNGYTAYTQPIKTKNGPLTKVIVGPELIKSELSKKIPALKALTKVEGKIAKFKPTK